MIKTKKLHKQNIAAPFWKFKVHKIAKMNYTKLKSQERTMVCQLLILEEAGVNRHDSSYVVRPSFLFITHTDRLVT